MRICHLAAVSSLDEVSDPAAFAHYDRRFMSQAPSVAAFLFSSRMIGRGFRSPDDRYEATRAFDRLLKVHAIQWNAAPAVARRLDRMAPEDAKCTDRTANFVGLYVGQTRYT
jgi:hypothetical protein